MTGGPAVILIGIDGGTLDLIEPWVAAGELPALRELLRRGARGPLRSVQPPLTPVAWSSMLTGCSPGQHGIFGFLDPSGPGGEPRLLSGGSLPLATVFELASAAGLRVGLLNVPWTFPPLAVNGWCLSGLDAPSYGPEIAHPAGLYEELCAQFGGYFPKTVLPRRDGYPLDALEAKVRKTGAMARYLARTRPVDLLAVAFVATDHVQHWHFQQRAVRARDGRRIDDLLLHTYRLVDREIAAIADECAGPRTHIVLASDHGAGPCDGGVNVNRWLEERGWLRRREQGITGRLRRAAVQFGTSLLPGALRERLRGRLAGRRRRMITRMLADGIDWAATRAFCWSDYGAISLSGAGDRERDLCELEEALAHLLHPETGERLMSAPLRGTEIYRGERAGSAPDLLAVTRGYRWEILTDFTLSGPLPAGMRERIVGPARRQGTHRLHGLVAIRGPGIRPHVLTGARIEDVAPTIMHLLGQSIPRAMDGRVLSEALDPAELLARPPVRAETAIRAQSSHGYSEDEAMRVERDLQGMGYL